jgi:site-specific recombinase XerD
MNLYKRHVADCQYRAGSAKDKDRSHRCGCSLYIEVNVKGQQKRERVLDAALQPVSSWTTAEKLAARNAEETGNPARPASRGKSKVTLVDAVETFLNSKSGESLSEVTIRKLRLTLNRLMTYCASEGITLLADVTLPVLTDWRATWEEQAPVAKANNQSRLRSFFRYCVDAEFISSNPALKLTRIQVKRDAAAENVKPLSQKDFEKLIKSIHLVKSMTPVNTARVAAMMKLQRYSGLALVDAVTLSKDELVKDGKNYRVVLDGGRQKSKTPVNVPIPTWLAEELLIVKNGNPAFFFSTRESTPKSAVSVYDKLYRQAFAQAGISTEDGLSHRLRHTYAVELLKSGVDIRLVGKALGHSSVVITERYYSRWNRAQQERLDTEIMKGW